MTRQLGNTHGFCNYLLQNYCSFCTIKYPKSIIKCPDCHRRLRYKARKKTPLKKRFEEIIPVLRVE